MSKRTARFIVEIPWDDTLCNEDREISSMETTLADNGWIVLGITMDTDEPLKEDFPDLTDDELRLMKNVFLHAGGGKMRVFGFERPIWALCKLHLLSAERAPDTDNAWDVRLTDFGCEYPIAKALKAAGIT